MLLKSKNVLFLGILVFLMISFLIFSDCFAETKEEKIDEVLESPKIQKLSKMIPSYKLSSHTSIFFGYDSNVKLSPVSKGDTFEEFLYSLSLIKPLKGAIGLRFNYDLDYLAYSDVNSASHVLNHLRFDVDKKIGPFEVGTGYDFSYFYYPSNAGGDFIFHKGFFYLRNELSSHLYQQFMLEYGIKAHTSRKALSDTISTFQDKELVDKRQGIEYSLGYDFTPGLSLGFKARYFINDSNARYLDFYDYKAYQSSSSIDYRLSKNIELHSDFTYLRKNYDTRTITSGTKKINDDVYAANIGVNYKLDKNNFLSLFYIFRNNSSNDPVEKYTENVITCGWQYNF